MAEQLYTEAKEKKPGIMYYLLVLYMIAGTDWLLFMFNKNKTFENLSLVMLIMLAMLGVVVMVMQRNQIGVLGLVVVEFGLIMSAWYHDEFSGGYILKMMLFVLGLCFFANTSRKNFRKAYVDLMTIICAVSLIGYALAPMLTGVGLPSITNISGMRFVSLGFSNICVELPDRNFGPFTEPSRYQGFINLYLIFLLFSKEKKDMKRIILGAATLVTTFSTTGYVSFMIILIAFVFSSDTNIRLEGKIGFTFLVVVAILILSNSSEFFTSAVDKASAGEESTSFTVRYNSIMANLELIGKNLFFGTGIANAQQAFESSVKGFSSNEEFINTTTVLLNISKFGIIVGGYYIMNLFKTSFAISKGLSGLVLFAGLVAMTSGISFLDSVLFNAIIFYHFAPEEPLPVTKESKYLWRGEKVWE